jgi:hypothetical protein
MGMSLLGGDGEWHSQTIIILIDHDKSNLDAAQILVTKRGRRVCSAHEGPAGCAFDLDQ